MKPKKNKPTRPGRSLLESLRDFLTPQVWKQGHQASPTTRKKPRWELQPLVLTLLALSWCCGDSQAERFETGKAFCAACLPKRRRPGHSYEGFLKALAKLPVRVLRAMANGVRQRLLSLFGDALVVKGFIPLGVDGSRLECPRTVELEQRLGQAGKKDSAPTLWLTALVHLRLGLLWAWRLGKGTASERGHLQQLLPLLPAAALVVADAGFNGFGLAQAILAAKASFLIRMSAKVTLLSDLGVARKDWVDGEVLYWPQEAQDDRAKPLHVRLICIRGQKSDVWLLSNVLDRQRLSVEAASYFYRCRWENEGLFRTYKRTLRKVKLLSRTVRLVHREAEGSLLALQLLLTQGAWALQAACSPRKVLLAIRADIYSRLGPRQRLSYGERLAQATREHRQRRSPKVNRAWPRRSPHKPPKAPKIRRLTARQKGRISQLKSETG